MRWTEDDLAMVKERIANGRNKNHTSVQADAKPSKYHNKKWEYKGMIFDSGRELERYKSLEILLSANAIRDLERQVRYELIPKCGTNRSVNYTADFRYVKSDTNEIVVEDSKGVKTRDYIIRKKLMLWIHGIEVREV